MKKKVDEWNLKEATVLILDLYLEKFAEYTARCILASIKERAVQEHREFTPEQIEDIRNEYVESIMIAVPGEINCVHRDMLEIINVCQTKMGEPVYSSVEELLQKEGVLPAE